MHATENERAGIVVRLSKSSFLLLLRIKACDLHFLGLMLLIYCVIDAFLLIFDRSV